MTFGERIKQVYLEHLPGARLDKRHIKAPCPFWLLASRENSPGKIASCRLEYPYLGFCELVT